MHDWVVWPSIALCRHYNMMCKFFGKQKPLERVNLADRMAELGLDQCFRSESWPDAAAVRELKTKVKNLTGDGFGNPFVYAEMRKYEFVGVGLTVFAAGRVVSGSCRQCALSIAQSC